MFKGGEELPPPIAAPPTLFPFQDPKKSTQLDVRPRKKIVTVVHAERPAVMRKPAPESNEFKSYVCAPPFTPHHQDYLKPDLQSKELPAHHRGKRGTSGATFVPGSDPHPGSILTLLDKVDDEAKFGEHRRRIDNPGEISHWNYLSHPPEAVPDPLGKRQAHNLRKQADTSFLAKSKQQREQSAARHESVLAQRRSEMLSQPARYNPVTGANDTGPSPGELGRGKKHKDAGQQRAPWEPAPPTEAHTTATRQRQKRVERMGMTEKELIRHRKECVSAALHGGSEAAPAPPPRGNVTCLW